LSDSFTFGLTSFYFLRHGETSESKRGILQGQTETELDDVGLKSAAQAGERLAGARICSIYASPLKRAWQTAAILSDLIDAPLYPAPGLMERNWGVYEGHPKTERPPERSPPGVEPLDAFSRRVLDTMGSISGPTPLLIVAHSGVFRVLAEHAGLPVSAGASIGNMQLLLFEPPDGSRRDWTISQVTD